MPALAVASNELFGEISMDLVHNRYSVGGSNYHFQFTPKYRKSIFKIERICKLIRALIKYKAFKLVVEIEAIEFGPDHVHVFVTNCKNYSVPQLAQHFKGYSSFKVRRAFPAEMSYFLWGKSFWSDGYFYESVGRVTSETVKFYIERQQGKHWTESKNQVQQKRFIPKQQSPNAFC